MKSSVFYEYMEYNVIKLLMIRKS